MKISISQAAKDWSLSRTTIYQKINSGELSRDADKKIDTSEMVRVFGEPKSNGQRNVQNSHVLNTRVKTSLNTLVEQKVYNDIQHKLELEQLRNEYLQQQLNNNQLIIEDYQRQINQLNKNLSQATASINEFAQTRLLELKQNTEQSQTKKVQNPEYIAKPNLKETLITGSADEHKQTKRSKFKTIISVLAGID